MRESSTSTESQKRVPTGYTGHRSEYACTPGVQI